MTKIEVHRIDRKTLEDEVTTGTPASLQEWKDIQELRYLEKEYDEFYHGDDYIENMEQLRNKIKSRYFEVTNAEREQ